MTPAAKTKTASAIPPHDAQPLGRRLAWFVALWAGGTASVGLVALAIRWILRA